VSVVLPPVIIDPIVAAVDDTEGAHYIGPFIIGAALYAILMGEDITHKLNVYKSADNGLTWTSMDQANRPPTTQSFDALLNAGVFTIVYTSTGAGSPLRIITFDTATDTFGAISVDGPLTSGNARIAQFASSDLCVFYGSRVLSIQDVVIFSGGAWGVPVDIPNGKNDAVAVIIGANDVAQLFYFDLQAPGYNLFLRTFTNGGVLGAEQAAFSAGFNGTIRSVPIGRLVIWNGDFAIPAVGGANSSQAGIWIGTPYTAPVWTFTILDPVVQPFTAGDFSPFALVDGNNNLIVFWTTINDPLFVTMSYAINPGAGFGMPVTFYNQGLDPPLVPPLTGGPFIDVFAYSVTRKTNGTFDVLAGFCGCPTIQCLGAGFLIDAGARPTKTCLL
jgi:hypothetical protein